MNTYTLLYKTEIFGQIEQHKETGLTLDEARDREWQYLNGDFGDCTTYDSQIIPEGHRPPRTMCINPFYHTNIYIMDTTTVLAIIKMLDRQIDVYSPADTNYSLGRVDVCNELKDYLQGYIEAQVNAEENKSTEQ